MDISIKVLDKKPEIIWNMPCYWGEITIKDFKEKFIIPVEYWTLDDYKKQWEDGLKRLKYFDISCLVTSVQDPLKTPLVNFWVLFKDKNANKIYIRNRLLIDELENKLFTPEICYEFIESRKGFDPNVSEWEIDIE